MGANSKGSTNKIGSIPEPNWLAIALWRIAHSSDPQNQTQIDVKAVARKLGRTPSTIYRWLDERSPGGILNLKVRQIAEIARLSKVPFGVLIEDGRRRHRATAFADGTTCGTAAIEALRQRPGTKRP